MSESKSKTQIVLELEGKFLLSGTPDDFIEIPQRGSAYFHEGAVYEVVYSVQTIGSPTSKEGSMLLEFLRAMYSDATHVDALFGGMSSIADDKPASGLIILPTAKPDVVMGGKPERLLYVRLKLVKPAPAKPQSIVEVLTEAAERQAAGSR